MADVNGDGKPDAIVANWWTSNNSGLGLVGILLGNNDGTFQAATGYPSGGNEALSVAVGDLNNDGHPDVVVSNVSYSDSKDSSGDVLLGNGDGTFRPAVTYDSGGVYAVSVAIADLNGDGKLDVVVANSENIVGVFLGNGDGTLQTEVIYYADAGNSVAIADVNSDGKPDLVVSGFDYAGYPDVDVLLGNGDGTFQAPLPNEVDCGYSVAVADANGDGKPDIVVAGAGTVDVLLGKGDGTFQAPIPFGSGGNDAYGMTVADLNGDGKPDIAVADYLGSFVGVLINTSLTATTTTLTSSLNPSNFGQSVTFTASVSGQQGFYKGLPTGTVTFFDGTTNLGSSALNTNGNGALTISTLMPGSHSITATYNGDVNFAASTSQPLSQVVQGAIALISPASLNFGNDSVGFRSAPQYVTLMNTGNIALTVSIGISGANGGDFGQSNNCPSSLAPNNSCTIGVAFDPTMPGTRSAALSFTDNAPNSPQTVLLAGVGVVPTVTFSPTSLMFPTQVIFTRSMAQKVSLTNTGLGILKISGAGISNGIW